MLNSGRGMDNGPLVSTDGTKVPCRSGNWLQGQGLIDCKQCEFQTSGDSEFVEDIAEVMLHRVFADFEVLRCLLIGITSNHGRNNLQFAGGEAEFLLPSFFS